MDFVEKGTLEYYQSEKEVDKVGCGIAENRHKIAVVCVYKNQP
jgi:hypothetical protein